MLRRSPSGSSAASSAPDSFSTAADSPVSAASSIARLTASMTRAVSRHPVAGTQDDQVAGHELASRNGAFRRRHEWRGRRRGHLAQRLQRALGSIFLDETQQHGEQHDDRDDDGFEPVTEQPGERVATSRIRTRTFLNCAARVCHGEPRRSACSSFGPWIARGALRFIDGQAGFWCLQLREDCANVMVVPGGLFLCRLDSHCHSTRDKGQGTREKGQGQRDKGQGKRDKGQGTRDKERSHVDQCVVYQGLAPHSAQTATSSRASEKVAAYWPDRSQ